MSATARRVAGRSDPSSAAEFSGGAAAAGEYQLTELKNVAAGRTASSQSNAPDLNVRLVQSIRAHPAFYDPHDAHYGNRHQDAQHRAAAWQQVAAACGWTGDMHMLAQMWRRLKDRYKKERTKGTPTGEPLDIRVASEMSWLDDYILDGMPAASSASEHAAAAAAAAEVDDSRQLFFMEGEEDLLGEDFVTVEEEEEFDATMETSRDVASPAGSNGSEIDVGMMPTASSSSTAPLLLPAKDLPSTSRQDTGGPSSSRQSHHVVRQSLSNNTTPATTFRFVNAPSTSHHQHHGVDSTITVSSGTGRSGGGATLIAHPKREGTTVVSTAGGSTLTMIIDPTTYYQNGTQKMYRLVNVADLDQTQHATLQHLRPVSAAAAGVQSGLGGGGQLMGGGEHERTSGVSIGRGSRKRMGGPLSPPSHAGTSGIQLPPPSSGLDHSSSPYGKSGGGQLGDDLILDDGIVGENTIVIDHQRDDEDSPLLADSPGMHSHHMLMGGRGGLHRNQHSPTLLGNGSGTRSAGGYSPNSSGLRMQNTSSSFVNTTSQYDADLALQHFISTHLARLNDDDKSLAKMNIQRILLDARFGSGSTLRVCMGEEEAELTDAAASSEIVTGE